MIPERKNILRELKINWMLKNRVKTLIGLIENTEIAEIEVSSFFGFQKIRLSKSSKTNESIKSNESNVIESKISKDLDEKVLYDDKNIESEPSKPISNIDKNELDSVEEIDFFEMKAPLVGTFYSSPKPSDPPFVNVGDRIEKGQVICIIEAMKIFNDIESEISGTVHEVCVDNASPVEFDQLIIKIIPD